MFPFVPKDYKPTHYLDEEFKTLRIVSDAFWILGWIIIFLAIIVVVLLFSRSPSDVGEYSAIGGMSAIPVGIIIIFFGLINIAISEIIKVILKIEKNTRKRFDND